MERIHTDVPVAMVEIEGKRYAVAARTVAVEEALLAAREKCAGKPAHRLYRAEVGILLGKRAARELFAGGGEENVDRMQMIHAGVCAAFERCGGETERARAAQRAEAWREIVDALAPVNELLRQLERAEAQYVIRRPGKEDE